MGRVTLGVIAEETGLSKFAVSRALSGKSGVSEETRRRVNEVAARIGYRKATSSAAKTIGVIFDDTDVINSELNMQIQSGVRREAQRLGFPVRILWTRNPDELERFARESDGLLIVGPHAQDSLARAYATRTPVVRLGWLAPLEAVDSVSGTDREGGAAVLEYLARLGHRQIIYVHGTPGYRGRLERLHGARDTVERLEGVTLHNLTWEDDTSFGEALAQLQADGHQPTAYFCAHDGLAVTVISELLARGYRIPEDVSVVGFGDFAAAQQILPHLTTVKIRGVEMGEMTVRLLDDRMDPETSPSFPLRIQVPCLLVERSSAGPVKHTWR
jgi:LacI family transcriptional regulator